MNGVIKNSMSNQDVRCEIDKLYQDYIKKQANKNTGHCEESFTFNIDEERVNHERIAQEIIDMLPFKRLELVLDVGSGFGDLVFGISRFTDRVIGLELDEDAVKISELKKELYSIVNVSFIRGIAEELPLKENSVDLVVSKTVLEHVRDVEKSLQEVDRVLKPGGFFYLEVPNYMWIKEGHYQLYMPPLLPKVFFRFYAKLMRRNPDFINSINYVTPRKLTRIFRKSSLKIRRNISEEMLWRILKSRQGDFIPPHYRFLEPLFYVMWFLCLYRPIYAVITKTGFYPVIILLIQKEFPKRS